MKIKMPQLRVEKNAGSIGSKNMPASWGLCWQFPVDKYAGNFNSGRKICRLIWVGSYAGDFRSEKNAGNVGSEQNVGKFGPEKKMRASPGRK